MKLVTSIIAILSFAFILSGQDWAPFVPGQVYFYQSDDNTVLRKEIKASYNRGTHTVMYFHNGFEDSCEAQDYNNASHNQWQPYKLDSLITTDTSFTYLTDAITIHFDHSIDIGDSFSTQIPNYVYQSNWYDSVQITLDSLKKTTFLGIEDSTKFFSIKGLKNGIPFNFDTTAPHFILSKNFGLLKYAYVKIPFQEYYDYQNNSTYSLVGITNDTVSTGIVDFTPNDLFVLQPGDILKWKKTIVNYTPYPQTTVDRYRDSLLSTQRTDSTFSYTFYRQNRGTFSRSFNTRRLAHLSRHNTFYINDGAEAFNWNMYAADFPVWNFGYTIDSIDQIKGWSMFIDGTTSDPFDGICNIHQIPDIGLRATFNTDIGMVYLIDDGSVGGSLRIELTAYRLGNQVVGNIAPLAIAKVDQQPLTLYPNPTASYVQLELPPSALQQGQLTLTDLTGRVVLHKQLQGNATVTVGSLPTGLYLVEVTANDQRFQGKLIVR